jgi:trimeric autotransporter adhesin
LVIGGQQEVTASASSHDTAVAGVVSENPSYLMNSGLQTANSVPVALLGRVPCQVVGIIRRGDLLVTSDLPGTATALDHTRYLPGCVIGKALADYNSDYTGIIEIAVGVK